MPSSPKLPAQGRGCLTRAAQRSSSAGPRWRWLLPRSSNGQLCSSGFCSAAAGDLGREPVYHELRRPTDPSNTRPAPSDRKRLSIVRSHAGGRRGVRGTGSGRAVWSARCTGAACAARPGAAVRARYGSPVRPDAQQYPLSSNSATKPLLRQFFLDEPEVAERMLLLFLHHGTNLASGNIEPDASGDTGRPR